MRGAGTPSGAGAGRALAGAAATIAAAAVVVGCGGSRQDAHEPSATYDMQVVKASFPTQQSIARPTQLELRVRNTGTATVPDVAVTVDSFNYVSNYPELAAAKRPIWAIERGPGAIARPPVQTQEVSQPGSGQTAYVNTWALGPLASGEARTFSWHVVPVKPGAHVVHYSVHAGLAGKSHAQASSGALAGEFAVDIAPAPEVTHVDPNTGKVEPGAAPPVSAP